MLSGQHFQHAQLSETVVVNGAGPVGLTFSMALLDRATALGLPKPHVQIWDPNMKPWREIVIRLPHAIATSLPEQVQMELWEETASAPQRLFIPGPCNPCGVAEKCRVHDNISCPSSQYTACVQVKQFQEVTMRYLRERHAQHCSFNEGRCPPEVMRGAAAVLQCYGRAARKANPISGNPVSEEDPVIDTSVASENGLFVLFDRRDVVEGHRDPGYIEFNKQGNGISVFQSHAQDNAVQAYIWPEDVTNSTGLPQMPMTHEQLINHGPSFGLRALFDCVEVLQGEERWWWEFSRRCRLQDESRVPVPREETCTLEHRAGCPGWAFDYPRAGEKARSPAFHAWFDAVRFQIALNLFKMGIFGSQAEKFLHKVRLCYARRQPYRYNRVRTEVEDVPVIYLGDSAGSTDFKKGLSCGRGLLCAARLAFDCLDGVIQQLQVAGQASLKQAFRYGSQCYEQHWISEEMVAEWSPDFDATFKYLMMGRAIPAWGLLGA